jgi:hypothetical protein
MKSRQQYIRFVARGDRWHVTKIATANGVPFEFIREIRAGDFVETIGKVGLEYGTEVVAWLRASNARSELDNALLAYAVTNDELELIRQTEEAERTAAGREAPDAGIDAASGKEAAASPSWRTYSHRRGRAEWFRERRGR